MCGRVRLSSDVSEIKLVFSIPPHRPAPNFPPSWNMAPTDQLPVVRYDRKAGERSLDLLRWGLIPHWAKDIKVGFLLLRLRLPIAAHPGGGRLADRHHRADHGHPLAHGLGQPDAAYWILVASLSRRQHRF